MTIHMATITRLTYGPYDHILLVSWSVVLKGNFPFKGLTLTSKKINEVSRKKSVPSYWIDTAGTFLPRVQEDLNIGHAFLTVGFLKEIELISRDLRRFTQPNVSK